MIDKKQRAIDGIMEILTRSTPPPPPPHKTLKMCALIEKHCTICNEAFVTTRTNREICFEDACHEVAARRRALSAHFRKQAEKNTCDGQGSLF